MVRCPSCGGLRGVQARHAKRHPGSMCSDCRHGRVITRTQFHNYWLARFSMTEIEEMGRAIWE